jgi:hypothetical protein
MPGKSKELCMNLCLEASLPQLYIFMMSGLNFEILKILALILIWVCSQGQATKINAFQNS